MTAARSIGMTSPVRRTMSSHTTVHIPQSLCPPACLQWQRKRKVFQTKLNLCSAPGMWLLLGVGVVLVGMMVTAAGYITAAPKALGGRGSTHTELAGPIVMGVGLFIFICSTAILYENRDRELLKQDLDNLNADNDWEQSQEQPSFGCQERSNYGDVEQGSWGKSSYARSLWNEHWDPRHNINNREMDTVEVEHEGRSTMLTHVLHHQEPSSPSPSTRRSPPHSSVNSDSCNSSVINFNIRTAHLPPSADEH